VITLSFLGIVSGALGTVLGTHRLGIAAVVVSVAVLLFGLAVFGGLVPGLDVPGYNDQVPEEYERHSTPYPERSAFLRSTLCRTEDKPFAAAGNGVARPESGTKEVTGCCRPNASHQTFGLIYPRGNGIPFCRSLFH
jgi:cytochrome c biogenesis protein CcdA